MITIAGDNGVQRMIAVDNGVQRRIAVSNGVEKMIAVDNGVENETAAHAAEAAAGTTRRPRFRPSPSLFV